MNTPELNKLVSIHSQAVAIGGFLDWLSEVKKIVLAERTPLGNLQPTSQSFYSLLAEHFDINLAQMEREKRALLEEFRAETSK